ncbi:glycoside hydrolase family 76 protein [Fulvivirgaceae bacterium BMA12]|uniref:Glycoside hydrolase family 76 protein n=1 Tax=Agaribacillus aureus TaxID=3051825 RepID=A0ABT8L3I1_9BACT|nr:glycoside hydrolase family 76 protein [Fulvivirgaceae bacterium BMA12]
MKIPPIFRLTIISLTVILCGSCGDDDLNALRDPDTKTDIEYTWSATADSMQEAVYTTYLTSNGTFQADNRGDQFFHYWWNAHMVDVLLDGYLRTRDEVYISRVKALVTGIKAKNGEKYPNDFNDDMEWLAIACTRAYETTGDQLYLDVAKLLWEEIKKSWSNVYGGGITWKINTPNGKNATSNAPAAILAMRLYDIEGDEENLQWAKDIFSWQKNTLIDPISGLVWDNIDLVNGEVVINKDWIFTYNIGTYIGAATELYKVTKDGFYLNEAVKTATSMMTSPKLTTEGLLRDEGQGDGGLFKGILVRYFTRLIQLPDLEEDDRKRFQTFFQFNAKTFYEKGISRPSMLCGPNWRNLPGDQLDLSTQLSGIMLIEAAARLEKD